MYWYNQIAATNTTTAPGVPCLRHGPCLCVVTLLSLRAVPLCPLPPCQVRPSLLFWQPPLTWKVRTSGTALPLHPLAMAGAHGDSQCYELTLSALCLTLQHCTGMLAERWVPVLLCMLCVLHLGEQHGVLDWVQAPADHDAGSGAESGSHCVCHHVCRHPPRGHSGEGPLYPANPPLHSVLSQMSPASSPHFSLSSRMFSGQNQLCHKGNGCASPYCFFSCFRHHLQIQDPLLTLVCIIVQGSALLWYSLSYIPYAQATAKRLVRLFMTAEF